MSSKKEMASNQTTPDSTTKEKILFNIGDEVLMQRRDGNFYLGAVVEIDHGREQCLVKFGDNTESWSPVSKLTKLSTGFDVMCVKCKTSQSKANNEILVCDRCSRGYHQLCHSPGVKLENIRPGTKWECSKCEELPDKRYLPVRKTSSLLQIPPPPVSSTVQYEKKKFPYKINDLEWDLQHKLNKEGKYCYCGKEGKWFLRMLQCGRCRQWFHSKCIATLQCPIFFGDRFFVFICSICNSGKEFIQRLEIKWVDVVHLSIFHLSVITAKKYLHVDNDILKFINSNWTLLQLPPKIKAVVVSDRRDLILNILTGNRNRFKCCREVSKRTTLWGLRVRVPPPSPVFSLPSNKPLSEQMLADAWASSARLNFMQISIGNNCRIASEWDATDEESPNGLSILHIESNHLILTNGVPPTGNNICIKSSAPRSEIDRRIKNQVSSESVGNFKSRKARKLLRRAMARNKNGKVGGSSGELPPTPPSSESNPEAVNGGGPGCGQGGDTSGPEEEASAAGVSTLDSFIPRPSDFEGRNNPFHSFPLSLTPVVETTVRPTKRRLSEKDIRITSNGEVKRRRIRRRKVSSRSLVGLTEKPRLTTATASPVKTPPPPQLSLQQLKTSVNHFFGAMNRIAAGEKFRVRAKRVTYDGKIQYLIDWGGSTP